MATVASVYEVDPYWRTAEQIMGLDEPETRRPKVRNKRELPVGLRDTFWSR
jgi:hypothetical protein